MHAKSIQQCLALCDPMGCSPPVSSVHGILQTRVLEWIAMPSSWAASQPRDQIRSNPCLLHLLRWQAVPYHQCHLGRELPLLHIKANAFCHSSFNFSWDCIFQAALLMFFLFLALCILLRKALPNLDQKKYSSVVFIFHYYSIVLLYKKCNQSGSYLSTCTDFQTYFF